jgi:uncharacterized phage protein (TIGR01671 family)
MREIKFRAWDGHEMHYGPAIEFGESGQLLFHSLGDSLLEGCPVDESAGHAVMQFTGLKDKNGKEIYDGDLITYERSGNKVQRRVEWDDMAAGYPMLTYNPLDIEVIGNIYENRPHRRRECLTH